MTRLLDLYERLAAQGAALAPAILPTLARLVFAAVLLVYFWSSARTKIGPGLMLSDGAFAQIFPVATEAAGYDIGKLGAFHHAVVWAGTLAEFALPFLLLLGLFTRLAALGMMGFVLVQSLTDIFGHMVGPEGIGGWFDRMPDAAILDQRALWFVPLATLALLGGGPLSADRLLARLWPSAGPAMPQAHHRT